MKTIYTITLILLPFLFNAQPGTLDAAFGDQGKVIFGMGNNDCTANFVTIQADEKILVCGSVEGENYEPTALLHRYMPDGSPDEEFADQGRLLIYHDGDDSYARSVAQLADNRIVLLVSLEREEDEAIALYCFHEDGSMDTDFGDEGIALLTFGSRYTRGYAMVIQPDGKIVIAGYRGHVGDNVNYMILVRYWPDGTIDSNFGDDGIATATVGDNYGSLYTLNLQPDGKIVAGGYCNVNDTESIFLLRFTADGEPDHTFHQDGKLITTFPEGDASTGAVSIQPDGKVVIAGYVITSTSNADHVFLRYNPDGTPDSTFHEDGIALLPFNQYNERPQTMVIQPDGKLLAGGFIQHSASSASADWGMMRLTSAGIPDPAFDGDGFKSFEFSNAMESMREMVLQPDGKIIAVGYAEFGNYGNIVIARINTGITTSTAATAQFKPTVTVYPNPATGNVQISYHLDKPDRIQINLIDASGKLIDTLLPAEQRTAGDQVESLTIPGSLKPGLYMIEIAGEQSGITAKAVVIQ